MSTCVLRFQTRKTALSGEVAPRATSAEVVIFPGIRIERLDDVAALPAVPSRRAGGRQRGGRQRVQSADQDG